MKIKRLYNYTLVELLAAMTVFTVLMLALMYFLSSAQKIWTDSGSKVTMFEDARIALNLIARDLQCAYYNDAYYGPFYCSDADSGYYRQIDLVAKLDEKPDPACKTNLAEVTYLWDHATASSTFCSLKRGVIGDNSGSWDFTTCDNTNWTTIFNSTYSSSSMIEVIPRVVDFKILPLKRDLSGGSVQSAGDKEFPYAVLISISLLDKNSYKKWHDALGSTDFNHDLVKNNKRTFQKIVLLGDRGQY